MGKIIAGLLSLLLALFVVIHVLVCPSKPSETWLLASVPLLGGIEFPRILALGLGVFWLGGGFMLTLRGISDLASVNYFVGQLRAGKTARTLFAEWVKAAVWVNPLCSLIAGHILRGVPYSETVNGVIRNNEDDLDNAVLWYKRTVITLLQQADLIRQAIAQAKITDNTLPDFVFPAVRVARSPGLWSPLKENDFIYACNGQLVESMKQLRDQLKRAGSGTEVPLRVLRLVQTGPGHPLLVQGEWEWKAQRVTIKRALPEDCLEDHAASQGIRATAAGAMPPTRSRPQAGTKKTEDRALPPEKVRLRCPRCGKSYRVDPALIGRRVECPAPPRSNGCGSRFRLLAPSNE